jgi:hypothetical protein
MGPATDRQCPECGDRISVDARACACGWRKNGAKRQEGPDHFCRWNDHGHICGKRGSLSDSIGGGGPWYCSEHYWALKGRRVTPVVEKPAAQLDAECLTEARNFCYDHGLDTTEKQRAYIREKTPEIGRVKGKDISYWQEWAVWTLGREDVSGTALERARKYLEDHPMREPGDDRDEVAA